MAAERSLAQLQVEAAGGEDAAFHGMRAGRVEGRLFEDAAQQGGGAEQRVEGVVAAPCGVEAAQCDAVLPDPFRLFQEADRRGPAVLVGLRDGEP
jgi:hypothetical protein